MSNFYLIKFKKFILVNFIHYHGFSFFQTFILNFFSVFYAWKYDEHFIISFSIFNNIMKLTDYLQQFLNLQIEHHQHFEFFLFFPIFLIH
jgi:hypothetical protein